MTKLEEQKAVLDAYAAFEAALDARKATRKAYNAAYDVAFAVRKAATEAVDAAWGDHSDAIDTCDAAYVAYLVELEKQKENSDD